MATALNSLRRYTRNLAHRAGLPRFWRWWTSELAPLFPASMRSTLRRRLTRPVIEFGDGEAIFWHPQVIDGALRMVDIARVPLSGDASDIAAAGRAAISALATTADSEAIASPKVVVALPPRQIMRKTLVLPAAVEENLVQALSYDLDRHTPFRPEQLYFDAAVIERDPAAKTINVDWVAALKTSVDASRRQVEEWGGVVVAVVPGPVAARTTKGSRLNLIPPESRPQSALWRQWQWWAPAALVAIGALAVLVVPLLQKREYAIALNLQTEAARQQAEASDALRTQLERQQGDYNYALTKKYAYPGMIQIVDEVTRLLPDDTWLTQMEVRSAVRGKDTVRELSLRGESANAGALISTLEDSKLVEQAALQSPTTKLQPGPGEVFVLGSRLRMGTPPDPLPVTATAGSASEAPPPPAADAAASVPTVAAPPTAAMPAPGAPPNATAQPAPAAPAKPSAAATAPATVPAVPQPLVVPPPVPAGVRP